jgi:hypothetical protein
MRGLVLDLPTAVISPPGSKDRDLILIMLPFMGRERVQKESNVALPGGVRRGQVDSAISQDVTPLSSIDGSEVSSAHPSHYTIPGLWLNYMPHG